MLADLATKPQPTPLLIEGPYGSASYFPDLANYDRVLFVAGGVGATFTLPIYRDLLRRSAAGEQIPAAKFIWTVRSGADAAWGIRQLSEQCEGSLPTECEVFVTGKGGSGRGEAAGAESMELQEREGLLGGSASKEGAADAERRGKPNLRVIIDEVFSHDNSDRAAVLVCGPSGMGASVRREVGRWVWRGRDVFWHSEEFGW